MNDMWDLYPKHKSLIDAWASDKSHPVRAAYCQDFRDGAKRIEEAKLNATISLDVKEIKWLKEEGMTIEEFLQSSLSKAMSKEKTKSKLESVKSEAVTA